MSASEYVVTRRLPARPGTYALVLFCPAALHIRAGRLGAVQLRPGSYVYVGSALGPGGLRARIKHHVRQAVKPHWHIDYLRAHARVDRLWYCCDARRREHQWAWAVAGMPGAVAVARFGASDCGCESHLFHFDRPPGCNGFRRSVHRLDRSHPNIRECVLPAYETAVAANLLYTQANTAPASAPSTTP